MNAVRRPGHGFALVLTLLIYVSVGIGYGIVNPLFEAPDEHWHYFTTQYVADNGRLPAVSQVYDEWLGQEAAQPPLYYLLGSLLIGPIDTAGARDQVWLNPYAWLGDASAVANVNRVVHTPFEKWPWQGYVMAAHILRVMSTLFGLGTLLCVYASGRQLWPSSPRRALLATSLVAFLPQFGFIHGAVTNDALISFLSSAAILQLLRLWLDGVSRGRLLLLGVTVGLAAISKNAGILLVAYAIGVLFLLSYRDRNLRLLADTVVLVILPALLISGWLWWRNWTLYGDFTAANQFIRIAGGDRGYTLRQVLGETSGLWSSFIAIFGWFNVRAPEWMYVVWNLGFAIATIGLAWAALDRLRRRQLGISSGSVGPVARLFSRDWFPAFILAAWLLVVYAGLVAFMLRTEAAQGRLLFPALVPIAIGVAHGLSQIPWRGIYWLAPLSALVTTLYGLFFVVSPMYAPPAIVDAMPSDVAPIQQRMGSGLILLGSRIAADSAQPGDIVQLTLYWRADSIPEEAPELVLEVFGRDLTRIGNVHSHHGRGLFPATLWPRGKIVAERSFIRVAADTDAPVLAWLQARLAGEEPAVRIGVVKVTPPKWPADPGSTLATLGKDIELATASLSQVEARPEDSVDLDVTWRVVGPPGADFTTLVHLGESGQPPLITGDRPPLGGEYPTHVWESGEIIRDRYTLRLNSVAPPGSYPVWIGMYDPVTLVRLPLFVGDRRANDDLFLVGTLNVGG